MQNTRFILKWIITFKPKFKNGHTVILVGRVGIASKITQTAIRCMSAIDIEHIKLMYQLVLFLDDKIFSMSMICCHQQSCAENDK